MANYNTEFKGSILESNINCASKKGLIAHLHGVKSAIKYWSGNTHTESEDTAKGQVIFFENAVKKIMEKLKIKP